MKLIEWALILLFTFLMGMLVASKAVAQEAELEQIIRETASIHGLNPDLAVAIATVESRLNPKAVGSLGEIGLFQLRPEFHKVTKGNVRANVTIAVRYLVQLKRRCAAYEDAFFVCFNYGHVRKLRYPRLFPYYKKVQLVLEQKRRANEMVAQTD